MVREKNFSSRKAGDVICRLRPGTAFGDGGHPTTALCIDLLDDYLRPGDTLLDVGTGSGILMIMAANLDAVAGLGFDRNIESVEIARENLALNHVPARAFNLMAADRTDILRTQFDLVVANILTETIAGLLDGVRSVLTAGGVFLCSGLILGNTHKVEAKMKTLGFEILEKRYKGLWVGLAGRKRQ